MIQQNIINAVVDSLEVITVANGFSSDLGLNVIQWGAFKKSDNDLAFIDVRDGEVEVDSERVGSLFFCVMPISIEALAEGIDSDETLRNITHDIYKALGIDKTFGGIVDKMVAKSHSIEIEQKGKRVGVATVNIELHFVTEAWI